MSRLFSFARTHDAWDVCNCASQVALSTLSVGARDKQLSTDLFKPKLSQFPTVLLVVTGPKPEVKSFKRCGICLRI